MKHQAHRLVWIAVTLSLLAVVGCGGPAYEYDAVVTGAVTVDGELAKSGTVTFHPVKEGKPSIGSIHPDGSYSLRTGQGDLQEVDGGTIASGEYIVTVSVTGPAVDGANVAEGGPPTAGPSLVAAKYASKETSDLKHTVKSGSQVINLELESAETEVAESADSETETTPNEEADPSDVAEPAASTAEPSAGQDTPPASPPSSEPQNETPPPSPAPEGEPAADGAPPETTPQAEANTEDSSP